MEHGRLGGGKWGGEWMLTLENANGWIITIRIKLKTVD